MQNFKAFMFDFDGTITEKGVVSPKQDMIDTLVDLAQEVPIACCTGRQMESFVKHGFNYFIDGLEGERREKLLKNIHLIAENGSMGYLYNMEKNEFEEFYRSDWPSEFVGREDLMNRLVSKVEGRGEVYFDRHRVVVVIATRLNPTREEVSVEEVYKLSNELYDITMNELADIAEETGKDLSQYLNVGNSGIGIVIIPADGDKDNGIKMFANYLKEHRGFDLDEKAREILVVGDRPQIGGNDHFFLNGNYGTAFTVGSLPDNGSSSPTPVTNGNGERVWHAQGTMFLIRREFFGKG